MSSDEDGNPGNPGKYVTQRQCNVQFGKVDLALFGKDGRGGMVKDLSDIKHEVKDTAETVTTFLKNHTAEEKEKGRDWRLLVFTIVGSVISSVAASYLIWFLTRAL